MAGADIGGELRAFAGRARNAAPLIFSSAAPEVVAELDAGIRPEFPVTVAIRRADGAVTGEMTVTWTLRPNTPTAPTAPNGPSGAQG